MIIKVNAIRPSIVNKKKTTRKTKIILKKNYITQRKICIITIIKKIFLFSLAKNI